MSKSGQHQNKERDSKIYPYPQPAPIIPRETVPREAELQPRGEFDDEISLYDLWCVIARQKLVVLLISGVSLLAGITYAWMSPDIFRAEVKMVYTLVGDNGRAGLRGELGRLSAIVGVNSAGLDSGYVSQEVALATLKSRSFTDKFLREQKVMAVLLADDVLEGGAVSSLSPQWRAYKRFDGQVRSVVVERNSGVITLAIQWYDPLLAADWANSMIRQLNAYLQAEAIAEAEQSITYLKEQLLQSSVVEVQQSIYRLIENQIKKIMVANVSDQYAFKVIDPAQVPEEAHSPRRKVIVMLALVFGLMSGLFVAFLKEYFSRQRTGSGSK